VKGALGERKKVLPDGKKKNRTQGGRKKITSEEERDRIVPDRIARRKYCRKKGSGGGGRTSGQNFQDVQLRPGKERYPSWGTSPEVNLTGRGTGGRDSKRGPRKRVKRPARGQCMSRNPRDRGAQGGGSEEEVKTGQQLPGSS